VRKGGARSERGGQVSRKRGGQNAVLTLKKCFRHGGKAPAEREGRLPKKRDVHAEKTSVDPARPARRWEGDRDFTELAEKGYSNSAKRQENSETRAF